MELKRKDTTKNKSKLSAFSMEVKGLIKARHK